MIMRIPIIIIYLFCSIYGYAQSFSFVFLNSRTDKAELPKEELEKLMDGHLKNIERLANEGKLLVAGPFEGGGGIFIMNTPSVEEAASWLSTDPGIQANRWRIEILPYQPRIGSVCKTSEPYEMVTYTFIRYALSPKEKNATWKSAHDDFVNEVTKSGDVVTEGAFGQTQGSILIMRGEVKPETLEKDQGVKSGKLSFEIKKLWVAKGAFCE